MTSILVYSVNPAKLYEFKASLAYIEFQASQGYIIDLVSKQQQQQCYLFFEIPIHVYSVS